MEYWKFLRSKVGSSQIIIPGADGAIINNGEILLVKNKNDKKWYLPGGLQELNESIERTVIREIKEELNINVVVRKLISIYSSPKWIKKYINGDIIQSLTFLLLVETKDIKIEIDKSEIEEYDYFRINELPDNIADYALEMCKDVLDYNGKTILK